MLQVSCAMYRVLVFFFCFLASYITFGQPSVFKADPDAAKDFFNKHNYASAIKVYQLLLRKEPDDMDYNLKIAECYLLSHSIKAKAIPHLEFLIKQEKFPDEVWLDLGKAYHCANRFDEAINAYNKYKTKTKDKGVDRLIEQCHNAKELIKHPLSVTFQNLGKEVNSEFPDFYPVISPDESVLYFTSRRKSPTAQMQEFDGFYASDIFSVGIKAGKAAGKIQPIAAVNTNLDEQVVDVSDDGTVMLFYIDHNVGKSEEWGDIWISRKINSKTPWLKPERLPENINAGFETSASFWRNPLTDEEALLVASSRSGTSDNPNYGETDIYMSRKLPNGQWGDLKNLGPNINTKYKEEFPKFSQDGKTIYFASQGHSSMGGFDVFKSVWDEDGQTWSPPQNIGYPINTADDDLNISFTASGRIAYMSAMREGGMGDLDIYRLILQDVAAKETIYKGYLSSTDSLSKISRAKIEVIDKSTNELYGTYTPDPNNCYYVIALPPGKWVLKIAADNCQPYSEDINIFEEVLKFSPEVTKNIKLRKQ